VTDIVVTRVIAASPATVYSFFTDIERWTEWQGVDGLIEARPGGSFRIRMPGAQVASGQFIELIPNQRIVFTWGWEGDAPPVPPGSTTVVIELEPDQAGTVLRLTHRDLEPPAVAEHHRQGWERYIQRLRIRAEGGDPGPDSPGATEPTIAAGPSAARTKPDRRG
jgi:uncharacterized protein YndB with AHSA1/START domain